VERLLVVVSMEAGYSIPLQIIAGQRFDLGSLRMCMGIS
jgi:hypothetical protein